MDTLVFSRLHASLGAPSVAFYCEALTRVGYCEVIALDKNDHPQGAPYPCLTEAPHSRNALPLSSRWK